jgi:hypothetical protein
MITELKSRFERLIKEAEPGATITWDTRSEPNTIRFNAVRSGTNLFNVWPHLEVLEWAAKSDDDLRQLLVTVSNGLLRFPE